MQKYAQVFNIKGKKQKISSILATVGHILYCHSGLHGSPRLGYLYLLYTEQVDSKIKTNLNRSDCNDINNSSSVRDLVHL